ncbi:DEAD/DEAH box helicase [Dyadobacter subterraneus]|uniref:DEAD/DEAH box helicase family protein n=1 Tax=Dyadobacter subterraneus TaxID=2773304 RepID=A0ABR9WG40_9BACT|nr:DEAD/DEAH box helicase [Dyadobacter subterraneus]MBE9464395.1 DEAD/DEAH box helicase family protein [Dyadobacter subterraneus]
MLKKPGISERISALKHHKNDYIFDNFNVAELSHNFILKYSSSLTETSRRGFFDIQPNVIEVDFATFLTTSGVSDQLIVSVKQTENSLKFSCPCSAEKKAPCEHMVQVLYNLMDRRDLRIFFDKDLRYNQIKLVAQDYGLENERNPDEYFQLHYANKTVDIKPKLKHLFAVNESTKTYLKDNLIPKQNPLLPKTTNPKDISKRIIVFGQHKYYDHFYVELFEALTTKEGKLKNPLTSVNPLDLIWKLENPEELKFYTGVSKFHNQYRSGKSDSDMDGLKSLVKNPLKLDVFYHDTKVSESISAASLVPIQIRTLPVDLTLLVDVKDKFHEVSGQLIVDGRPFALEILKIRYNYFVMINDTMHLVDNPDVLRVIDFFKQNNNKILVYESKFEEFQNTILSKVEDKIRVTYAYLKSATQTQLRENGFERENQQLIYLSDLGNYILITPVMRYGNIEIPVLSKKQIYSTDSKGRPFTVERDDELEVQFTSTLLRQHPDFYDQLGTDHFYLSKERFLDEGWFLDAFEEWTNQNIIVLGFSELKNNKLNQNKATVSLTINSGTDWFNTSVQVKFGKEIATLKHLSKSIRNKSKFVELGDGTLGILPQDWIEKFAKYFEAGEIAGEVIRTPKINFTSILELYEDEVLSQPVKNELLLYTSKFSDFESIKPVEVPKELKTSLREYQKDGLNWLNFLDEFGFGGCLADDMGLGKTVQIIAFILSQRNKGHQNTNLIVVPTSLIFNWQAEVEKFAPSIKIHTVYGSNRVKDHQNFDDYEIILTSYGTLLSDIKFLKEYRFNYIFLDESQAIKNPESQRYKASRLLQSRNKIVLTGTPIENNTYDLYGQLSFACPGLLGNKIQFKNHYAIPIDRFEDSKRARELQKKVNPFILRRTKQQVATELPDKTEMVIYCEMGAEQRKVYDSYSDEFRHFLLTHKERDLPRESLNILAGLTKLRQICDSPALINDEEYYGDSSAKIEVLIEQIESKAPQHKILVFSQFVKMLDLIKKELVTRNISFEYLTGQTKNRSERVESFQNDEGVRVFLISLKAGGVGLNLTEADYVYLVDPWWNPAVENQAIDRSYRIGQKKNVVAVRLICPDTIEEKIMKMQDSKRDLANDLVKTDVSILKSLSKSDLLELL